MSLSHRLHSGRRVGLPAKDVSQPNFNGLDHPSSRPPHLERGGQAPARTSPSSAEDDSSHASADKRPRRAKEREYRRQLRESLPATRADGAPREAGESYADNRQLRRSHSPPRLQGRSRQTQDLGPLVVAPPAGPRTTPRLPLQVPSHVLRGDDRGPLVWDKRDRGPPTRRDAEELLHFRDKVKEDATDAPPTGGMAGSSNSSRRVAAANVSPHLPVRNDHASAPSSRRAPTSYDQASTSSSTPVQSSSSRPPPAPPRGVRALATHPGQPPQALPFHRYPGRAHPRPALPPGHPAAPYAAYAMPPGYPALHGMPTPGVPPPAMPYPGPLVPVLYYPVLAAPPAPPQKQPPNVPEDHPNHGAVLNGRYLCEFKGCSLSFFYRKDLNNHMIRAHDPKPFKCPKGCGQEYATPDSVTRHLRKGCPARGAESEPSSGMD